MERSDDIDRLEHEGDEVEQHIEEAREDWEQKERDSSVPGAQPAPGEEEEPMAGAETDPERVDEQGGP